MTRARPLADGLFFRRDDRLLEEIARPLVGGRAALPPAGAGRVALAGGVQVGGARLRRLLAGGFGQDLFQSFVFDAHRRSAPHPGNAPKRGDLLQDFPVRIC